MRALYRDKRWSSEVNGDLFSVTAVGKPTAVANMRNVYIRAISAASASLVNLVAYRTRADARANSEPIASAGVSLGSAATTVLTNTGANPPDMTGMSVTWDASTATDEQVDVIYGYTSSPDLDLCDDYAELVREYTGSGQSMARYENAVQTHTAGKQTPAAFLYVKPDAVEAVTNFDTRELSGRRNTLRFQLMLGGFEKGDSAGVIEEIERRLRDDVAALESIVIDERRTMDGRTDLCRKVSLAGIEMPSFAAKEYGAWMLAALLVDVTIFGYRSDYTGD